MKTPQRFKVLSSKKQRKVDKSIRVIFPLPLYKTLSESFSKDIEASREGYSIAQCGYKSDLSKKNVTYMVKSLHIPGDENLLEQSSVTVTPKAEFLEEIFCEASDRNSVIMEMHTHLGTRSPNFSWVDIDHGLDNGRFLKSCKIRFVMSVFGSEGFSIAEYDSDHDSLQIPENACISTMTRTGIKDIIQNKNILQQTIRISPRYDRQVLVWGDKGQMLIENVNIGIVGLGGTGSVLLQILSRMGVKNFTLCDDDIVDESNLSRMPFSFIGDIGKKKTKVAQNYLKKVSKDMNVTIINSRIQNSKDDLKNCDIIMGCVDSEGTRHILNEVSLKYFIPYIDTGTEISIDNKTTDSVIGGRVRIVMPSITGCLACMGSIDNARSEKGIIDEGHTIIRENAEYIKGTSITPSVITLNTIIASIAVQEAINIILGKENESVPYNYFKYNATDQTIERMAFEKDGSCLMCGRNGVLGSGDVKKYYKHKIIKITEDEGHIT